VDVIAMQNPMDKNEEGFGTLMQAVPPEDWI